MTDQELQQQFARCMEWQDADQFDMLALEFHRAGFPLNAVECFRRADVIRDCAFAEAFPAELAATP